MVCPYYQASEEKDLPMRVNGYCRGYLSGKLRVPTTNEEASFCLTENYPECLVFGTRMKDEKSSHNP